MQKPLVLSTHHSRVWLDMAYSTGVKKLVLLTASPDRHLIYYTTGMANLTSVSLVSVIPPLFHNHSLFCPFRLCLAVGSIVR